MARNVFMSTNCFNKGKFMKYWSTLRSFLRVKGGDIENRFAIALAVSEICLDKETTLLSDFSLFLAYFSCN